METNISNWFEIPASDLDRAKAFYENVFDFEMAVHEFGPVRMAWFPRVENSSGSTGTLVQNESYVPSHEGSMIYLSVEDIDATLDKIKANGGKVLNPKSAIGEHGFVAHFEDSEGNRVALHSGQ